MQPIMLEERVWSIYKVVGTRYKMSPLSDLMVDLRFQYAFPTGSTG